MILNAILLDGAQGLLLIIPIAFILHLVLTVLVEGLVLFYFKYGSYKKCTVTLVLANFISLVLGLVSMSFFLSISSSIKHVDGTEINLIVLLTLFYLESVILEGIILKVSNKNFKVKNLIPAVLLMNLITYVPIYLIMRWTGV